MTTNKHDDNYEYEKIILSGSEDYDEPQEEEISDEEKILLRIKSIVHFWKSLSKFWLAIGLIIFVIVCNLCFDSIVWDILTVIGVLVGVGLMLYLTYYEDPEEQEEMNIVFNPLKDGLEFIQADENGIKFEDLTVKDPVDNLMELYDFLVNPNEYIKKDYIPERKILFVGDKGSGKDTLIKAFSNETGLPILRVHAARFFADEKLFDNLFKLAPHVGGYIIQIDSFEKINAPESNVSVSLSGDIIVDTLLQSLAYHQNVLLFATCEDVSELDKNEYIVSRCFKKVITMPFPDFRERYELIKKFVGEFPIDNTVDFEAIAKMYFISSIGEIKYLVKLAKSIACKAKRDALTHEDFFNAWDLMTSDISSKKHSKESQKLVAYHEAGHAIVHYVLAGKNAVLRVISTSRGDAGGYTMSAYDEEKVITTKEELLNRVCFSYGGRCAEKLVFNHLSTGASSDIQSATSTILSMIQRYGMSDEIGPINVSPKIALLSVINESHDMRNLISKECARIAKECEGRTMQILTEHRKELEALANYLIEHESISGSEMEELLKNVSETEE